MFRKFVFASLVLFGDLFGGGDPLSLRLDVPIVEIPHIEQRVLCNQPLQQIVSTDALVVFKSNGYQQGVNPPALPEDLAQFGISRASSSFDSVNCGSASVVVQFSGNVTQESFKTFEQVMASQNLFPEKALTSEGTCLVRCDGSWMTSSDYLKIDPNYSPKLSSQEEAAFQGFLNGQGFSSVIEQGMVQSAPQQVELPQTQEIPTSVTYHRNSDESFGIDIGKDIHIGGKVTYSNESPSLSPAEQKNLLSECAHQMRLEKKINGTFSEQDAIAERAYVSSKEVGSVSRLLYKAKNTKPENLPEVIQDAEKHKEAYGKFLQGVHESELMPSERAVLQGIDNTLKIAQSRLQQQEGQSLVKDVAKREKHTINHNARRQKHYAKKVDERKDTWLAEYKYEHAQDSVEDLRYYHHYSQKELAYQKDLVDNHSVIVNRASPNALQPRVDLALAKFNVGMEEGKQKILEGLIQKKTFTAKYQNDLNVLKQKLENKPKDSLTVHDVNCLSVVQETLATSGAVHKAAVTCKPEVTVFLHESGIYLDHFSNGFVGNAFENHIFVENLNNLSVAADLHRSSYSDQPAGDYANAIAHFSDSAVAVLSTDPISAQALTNFSTAFTSIATGLVKGVALGAVDSVLAPIDMALHPIETLKALNECSKGIACLFSTAVDLAHGDPQAFAAFDKVVTEFMDLPLEAKAQHFSRFATAMLMPSPSKLAKIPGVRKGINALDKIARRELKALNAVAKVSKAELVTYNGVQLTKTMAKEIATIEKGAGRVLSAEETLNAAKNLDRLSAHKAPLTSAFARGVENQTRSGLLKSKTSFEKLIMDHERKLAEYIKNPGAFDNIGVLKAAKTDTIRQKIIEGRCNALQKQIVKQKGELQEVLRRLERLGV